MFSHFFIDRPKFAFVISILITMGSTIALSVLPVSEFPDISPPQVSVSAFYPGANMAVVESTVAVPIETEADGVDDITQMSSTNFGFGSYSLSISFEMGTDPDIAAVNAQNWVAIATNKLPEEVCRRASRSIRPRRAC